MERKWWHGKVAYQIYPKSFMDANGDGVGDLRGIIEKLDYLKELGVDIIWISPVYQSPFVDQGYDISDYYAIDPVFGTMDDMDELVQEAKKREMYIIMDLVVNHCSDKHEWFQKAIEDPDGKYGKYFYLKRAKDKKELCNWRSYFGGSVWDKLPGHEDIYYLHMFAKEQPDLNWENSEVREEIYKMIRWWLEKGIAGFRLDAIINIKKDLSFQNYPADREDEMCSGNIMLQYADGIHDFLQEMKREAFAPYEAFTIGELFDFKKEELEKYIGANGCFESIFDFSTHILGGSEKGWYDFTPVTPEMYKNTIFNSKALSQEIGFMANIIENHDEPRGVSHYIKEGDVNETSKKLLAGIKMMNFGLPFLYQGQEIGMENTVFSSIDEINDINTIDQYYIARENGLSEKEALEAVAKMSRDNARTPVQWSDQKQAGFTTAEPWLKVNPNYIKINVKEQSERADSVLAFYKELISLRKSLEYGETIVYGKMEPAFVDKKNVIAFYRNGNKKLLVAANYQSQETDLFLQEKIEKIVINNMEDLVQNSHKITLLGYQFVVLEIKE